MTEATDQRSIKLRVVSDGSVLSKVVDAETGRYFGHTKKVSLHIEAGKRPRATVEFAMVEVDVVVPVEATEFQVRLYRRDQHNNNVEVGTRPATPAEVQAYLAGQTTLTRAVTGGDD